MALDANEYRKRREQRAQARQARQAQQRQTRRKLILATAILLACGILIFTVARSGQKGKNPGGETPPVQNTETQDLSGESTANTEAEESPVSVVKLAAAGDLNINDSVVASGDVNQDYTGSFMDVAHLLADADITALNFEGVLTGAPYGSSASAPQTLPEALKNAGVDVLQLANSYAIHEGMAGLSATIAATRAAGLEPLGVYPDNGSFRNEKGYTIHEINGIKIAFLAFTKGMNGMALPVGSEDCVNLLYNDYATTYQNINTEKILTVLESAEKERPDIIVAMLHWGSEFNDTISSSQEEILSVLTENGVDIVLGTHSHYVQQMKFDPEAGTFVAYSLGDFFSDAKRAGTEYSVILELEITKDNLTKQTKVTGYQYTPIFTVAEPEKPLRIVRIHEAIAAYEANHVNKVSEETYLAMKYALERIADRVAGE